MEGCPSKRKERWVQGHAERLFRRWRRRRSPFNISPEFIRHIERDLSRSYDQPLLKAFVERTT